MGKACQTGRWLQSGPAGPWADWSQRWWRRPGDPDVTRVTALGHGSAVSQAATRRTDHEPATLAAYAEDDMPADDLTPPPPPPEVMKRWVAHVSAVLATSVAAHSPAERKLAVLHALPSPWSEEP
jgi:hypothetical protein